MTKQGASHELHNRIHAQEQFLIYKTNEETGDAHKTILECKAQLQILSELKLKEYRVLLNRLQDALQEVKEGQQPYFPDFISTILVHEDDEKPFTLTEEGILKKIAQLESRMEELLELLPLMYTGSYI